MRIFFKKKKKNKSKQATKNIEFFIFVDINTNTRFSYQKKFYQKMSLKNTKALRKRKENLQPQMPKLKFLKTLVFPRALQKLQNCNFSFFSYLNFF